MNHQQPDPVQVKQRFYSSKSETLVDEWCSLTPHEAEAVRVALQIVVDHGLTVLCDGSVGAACQLRSFDFASKLRLRFEAQAAQAKGGK